MYENQKVEDTEHCAHCQGSGVYGDYPCQSCRPEEWRALRKKIRIGGVIYEVPPGDYGEFEVEA